ncbi:CD226 antigen-like isoform X2 [Sander lucioperca]|uniref:CD226 antigen-like isoform X2 n=1 Tax=Sander lucioperca TaxID=283035 RepID=UPI00125D6BE5|nr:CD226 antigen-like isoform X2 [Sander lucioperca]
MVPLALFFVLLTVPVLDSSGDPHQLTAKPGQDVPLHCQVPKDADIAFIVWSRPDLESMKYVLLYKENRTHENYQFSSYRGRVNQSDPKMKDGDVSVVLKNVSVNDTGTYECGVIIGGNRKPEVINTIMLNVTDSGHTDGGGILKLLPVIPVIIVIFIAMFFGCKKSSEQPVAAENEKNILFQDSTPFINPPTGTLTVLQGIGEKYKKTQI